MTPRTMRALADLADALRAEADAQERPPAAAELGVTHGWLLELIGRGAVRAIRYGRVYRIERAEVERLKAEGVPPRAALRRLLTGADA